ncbi:tryptophan permease [Parashewanella curva]|uniref:Aromatic amino acid permease n=1 Tax=Parashewanella curva TaxID=2338552 RepID=A0A3L8PXL2_9GAMM|nr:aromatic amino acid transport family protein [Parashewanella curva]RLV59188.1 tryptophan permease [Parashewanella curva]
MAAAQGDTSPSVIGGAMIVAGTAVGAGMFTLPVVGAGMWFSYSVLMLLVAWFCMMMAGLYLLEVNLHYKAGVNFDSLTKTILGNFWRTVSGISIAFLMYVLTYAYVSGGGSVVNHSLNAIGLSLPQGWAGLVFAGVLAAIVIIGTKHVGRISTIMLGGMLITFFMATGNLLLDVEPAKLWMPNGDPHYSLYILGALPVGLASFGFQQVVPSLVKYYDKSASHVLKAILIGTVLALVIYICWMMVTMGHIARSEFSHIIALGGNMGALIEGMSKVVSSDWLSHLLTLFANLAVASSFLGVSLALFDFIADLFGFDDSWSGRIKSGLVTFVPPTVLGIFLPNGFIMAIGFAALAGAISVVVIPCLMTWKVRKLHPESRSFRVPGGSGMLGVVFFYGIAVMICHLLNMAGLLPMFS